MKRALVLLAAALLAGCGTNLKEINQEPALSPVGAGTPAGNAAAYNYPDATTKVGRSYSLWNDRQSRLFTDPRALNPGDLLTVRIEINDRAKFDNESDRKRTARRSLFFGASGEWEGFSGAAEGEGAIGSSTTTDSTGSTKRSENLVLSVAATVIDVMPNGNMVISGSQEVRVNYELRVLTIAGIVRPIDIGPQNTINYDRIAEARISYGGRGRLSEVQQPPWGQQLIDQVLPF